jgi:hypothetical protein
MAIAAGSLGAATTACAVDASGVLVYSAGPVHIRPHLAVSARYDDNIFYRPSRPTPGFSTQPVEGDFISVISPGVNLQLGRKEHNYLLLDYTMDQLLYLDHDDQNSRDHNFSLNSKLEWKRITLEGSDRIQFLSGILGGGSNLGQRVDRTAYYDNYTVTYGLTEKTGVYVEGSFDALDFDRGTPLYDSNTLIGTGGFLFKATPKTSVFGELYYGQTATDPNVPFSPTNSTSFKGPHAEFFGGFAGVKGDFTSRLSGRIKGGYEFREFSDGTPAPSSPVVEASLDQKFSEKTSATLTYSRRNSVSVQVIRQAYTADAVAAQLTQVLSSNGKLVGTLGGVFENDGYERSGGLTRNDRSYRARAALTYNLQLWLSAGLSYEFESYRSNAVIDYDVNRVTLKVAVGY